MKNQKSSNSLLMITVVALVYILLSGCLLRRPEPPSSSEEIGEVCFYQQLGEPLHAQVKTKGCYSTRCTRQVQKVGSLIIDLENRAMRFTASWVLAETSGFPIGCTDDCGGGGTIDFTIETLEVGDWSVYIDGQEIGKMIFPSGRMIERQCLSP
ncbi:MAG: hypothetical protein GTO18_09410 [Anaerolineales bacterium]|nr:hypothetical protein [Anaerolineales bacterium]